jgi:hypothetical protein
MSKEKMEVTKKDLAKIADTFLNAMEHLDTELLIRDNAAASVAKKDAIFGVLLRQEILLGRSQPETVKATREKYQALRDRIPEQLQQEPLDVVAFLEYLLGSADYLVP